MMDKQRVHELFWKYTGDKLSVDEEAEFFRLLANPMWREELQLLATQLWEQTAQDRDTKADDASRMRIQRIIRRVGTHKIRKLPNWPWAAAVCALLFIIPYWLSQKDKPDTPAIVHRHEISTGNGQKKKITLPDSSVIYLNAASSIRYDDHYNRTDRKIVLNGEAFFEVSTDREKPFRVFHGPLYTEVLGTSFNISAFSNDNNLEVSVLTGAVNVLQLADSSSKSLSYALLRAGQQLIYDKRMKKARVSGVKDIGLLASWKSGVLVLDDRSFTEVASMLKRWYNVNLHFERPALEKCRFTGSFDNLPVNKVLDLLKQSSAFSYKMDGRDIYIYGKGCK